MKHSQINARGPVEDTVVRINPDVYAYVCVCVDVDVGRDMRVLLKGGNV